MSTEVTIKFPVEPTELENDPDSLLSSDVVNGTFVVDGGSDGEVLVRDSTHVSGVGTLPQDTFVGPEGPQGPTGPQGPQGPQGPPGSGGGGVTDPLVVGEVNGGSANNSAVTIRSTTHATPIAGSDIIFRVKAGGSAGSAGSEMLRLQGLDRRIVLDSTSYFAYRKIDNSIIDGWTLDGVSQNQISFLMSLKVGSTTLITDTGIRGQDGFFTRYLGKENQSLITIPSDGNIVLNNWNENGFDRLVFGGSITSTAHPALKRNGAALETKLANDSAYAQHNVSVLGVVDGVSAPAAVPGKAVIFVDSADGDLKVIFGDGIIKTLAVDS